jgi:son of sevenless
MPMSPSAQDYVLAMHDFAPVAPNATCLSFLAGQVIHVLNRDPSGWWDGELDGQRGWFPSNYVNTDTSAMALIQSSKVCLSNDIECHVF